MKKLILILLGVTLMTSINAQEKGKIRVGGNLGLSIPHAGIGLGGDLDIRYNIMDNVNAGIKFTGEILMKDLSADDVNQTVSEVKVGQTQIYSDENDVGVGLVSWG